MVIFYFLGVGPPCCSILCQFWLCEEAQCVYLCRHLGSLSHWLILVCALTSDQDRSLGVSDDALTNGTTWPGLIFYFYFLEERCELSLKLVRFEIPFRHPSGDVKWAVDYKSEVPGEISGKGV